LALLVLGPSDSQQDLHISSPGSHTFGLGLKLYGGVVLLGLWLTDGRLWDFSVSIIGKLILHNKSPSLFLYLYLYLSISPIGCFSGEP
jgi:hypothetical protein